MQKRAPTLANILVIVLFALSCFGLLLFLWDSFGGPVPLKPKGYRFTVELSHTLSLAEESDVRISGVNVGHVVSLATHRSGLTDVTVEMNHQYAPVASSDRMILRQKTLLGETYIEMFPQRQRGAPLPDGGRIPASQVEPALTLEDVFSLLDPKTRAAFKLWQQSVAAAYNGRGEQLNSDFAELEPFAEHANKLVGILASQEGAVRAVVHNTGVVFDALTERDHQFRGLIENGERTFHALAQSSRQFADAFRALPTFEQRGTKTLREFDRLATVASPVLDESRAWERALTPLLQGVRTFTPSFEDLVTDTGTLTSASKRGLPAFERSLGLLKPLLGGVTPTLRNFDPFLKYLGDYVPELQGFLGNVAAATEAHDGNPDVANHQNEHYLRGLPTINPQGLAVYSQRVGTNRANPYFHSGAFRLLGSGGLQVFSNSACADSSPSVSGPANTAVPQIVIEQLTGSWNEPGKPEQHQPPVANTPESTTNAVGAPACTQQSPFTWEGVTSQFPHTAAAK
jgi:phospholipid/cholesterol/gamma-HCH transport system substrate-binding protein